MPKEYKIGLIGLGLIAVDHIAAIGRVDCLTLAAVCDNDADKLNEFVKQTRAAGYRDYQELIDSDIDAVVIALPHYLHAKVAIEAMRKGLHVLVEKPVAISLDELNLMEAQAEINNVILLGADTAYFDPRFTTARDMINEFDTGKFLFGAYVNHRDYMDAKRPAWFLDSEKSGGGQFMNIGIHRIAAVRHILGNSRQVVNVVSNMQSIDGVSIETATQMFVSYDDGSSFVYEECGLPPVSEELSQRLHLVFEKGVLFVGKESIVFSDSENNITEKKFENISSAEMYCNLYRNFVSGLRGGELYPTFEHNAADVKIALQAMQKLAHEIVL